MFARLLNSHTKVNSDRQDDAHFTINRREKLNACFDPEKLNTFEDKILNFYGASSISRHIKFLSGYNREVDSIIENEILERLEKLKAGHKLRVLEIACGRTLPRDEYYGAPWLSRRLSAAFPNEMELVSSDLTNYLNVCSVDRNGILHYFDVHVPIERRDSVVSDFKVISSEEVSERIRPFYKKEEDWDFILNRFIKPRHSENWFIRPQIDPIIERTVFGLKIYTGVNMTKLSETIPPDKKFDVIFGRNLTPPAEDNNEVGRTIKSCRSFLARAGCGYIQFDKGVYSSGQIMHFGSFRSKHYGP
jgi:hypothetical protein